MFRGHLPGRLKVLFSICPSEFSTEEQTLVLVQMMMVEKDGRAGTTYGLVTVIEWAEGDAQKNLVVNIRSLITMAHLIQDPMVLK